MSWFGLGGNSATGNTQQTQGNAAPAPAPVPTPAPAPQAPPSSLDTLNQMMAPPAPPQGNPVPQSQAEQAVARGFYEHGMDANSQTLSQLNFAQYIPAEVKQKAMQGDPEAFDQVMNRIAQGAALAALSTARSQTEEAVGNQFKNFREKDLPSYLQDNRFTESARAIPEFQNPALQPFLEGAKQAFLTKNPRASQQEVNDYLKTAVDGLKQVFAPPTPVPQGANQEIDWAQWSKTNPSH